MRTRALVIGLDGADLSLIQRIGREQLPSLFRLLNRGSFAAQQSVLPPATLPNWATFLTGVSPGHHGVFDFTTRVGYRVRFTAGTVREAPTVAARLDQLGLRCAVLGFPGTYPPERLEHGCFVSGWDSPVAFEADESYVWPPSLFRELTDRFGPPRFDDADEFAADNAEWIRDLPEVLGARIARRVDVARWLLKRQTWDLMMVYFGESDTAAHYLYGLFDPASPRHPGRGGLPTDGLLQVYRTLDGAVGELCQAAGEDTEITIVSDHGFGGSSDKVLYLNRVLAQAGLLRFRPSRFGGRLTATAKELALTRLPPRTRQRVFGMMGRALPGWLESRARFASIDMDGTAVFSDELNYFPALHFNIKGREPRGRIHGAERERFRYKVEDALLSLRDPWSGRPVVEELCPREELFSGPYLQRAPDLLLRMALDGDDHHGGGYSYNLMPSAGAPAGHAPFRRLASDELLGRKGRSLPGSHRERGLLLAAGPRVAANGQIEATIADATATLLARLDIRVPPEADGRVLWEALADPGRQETNLPAASPRRCPRADEARIEQRLRALGYVE